MTNTSRNPAEMFGMVDIGPASPPVEWLLSRLAGELITPDSPAFDDARQLQDFTVDKRPLAIVRAADTLDVAAAVDFAREYAHPLAVRSGGHSLAGHSMADDALVIDLSTMKGIDIDPATRTARVQAGATSGDLAELASEHGLALSTGDTSSVGFGGLTTGGGIGFMVRKHGLTIDNLLSATVVTAAGKIVTASEEELPELFWAIRGGGGNFGIVTEFTFRLAPVSQILGGDLLLPVSREVIRGYLEYAASAPDELSTIGNIMHAPPAPFVPDEWVGKPVLNIIVCWAGDETEGQRALEPLRALAAPVADTVRPMPYPLIYLSTAHQAVPHGAAVHSMFADALSDATLDAFLAGIERATSPFSIVHLRALGGQLARIDNAATAFAHRDSRYMASIIGVWLDPEEDPAPHRAWAESVWQAIRHEATGVYVNFIGHEDAVRIADAYPPATLARLREVKQMYDPDNLFRFNQNIAPAS
ncbi:MAG TPA: FAD-binding oxidoreductase [Thermomicrobiales bacterium]|nr:FAD-binding oxidoreductase [Thermomicrobiales bacterium]